MKNTFILTYLLLIVLLLGSCKSNDNLESLKVFKQLALSRNKDNIYVIPGSGCTGCISDIETLAINNVSDSNKYFLFTKIKSVKLFRNRFGIDFINHKNVILDTADLFKYPNNNSDIYPLLLSNVNGVFKVIKSFKP
jgi:hypothetical protein